MLEGAYAFVGLTNKKLVGARDPLGIRPLVLGETRRLSILASETCALDIIGAQYRARRRERRDCRDLDEDGVESLQAVPAKAPRPCIFEYIYFARPDSIVGGRSVYDVRKAMRRGTRARGAGRRRRRRAGARFRRAGGDRLSRRSPAFPYELGIIRNHYVGRTFIEPTQQIRQLGVRLKHSANRAVVDGKRIVLIDDSIVRGTTSVKIVQMMRDAGAREVHFRIASPPITHPDYYGIDTPERDKLLAATHDLEGMRRFIGADSLAFLSVDGIYRAMGEKGRDPVRPQFTDHCFTGEYPTALTDTGGDTKAQLSLSRKSVRDSRRRAGRGLMNRCLSRLPAVSRSSPAPRAASVARRRWRWRAPGAHVIAVARTSAGSRNSTTRFARRQRSDAGAARHARFRRALPARRRALRALRHGSIFSSATPACSGRSRRSPMSDRNRLGRGDGGQRHRQLAVDPVAGPFAPRRRGGPRGVHFLARRTCRAN